MLCAVGQVTVTSPRHRLLDNLTLASLSDGDPFESDEPSVRTSHSTHC